MGLFASYVGSDQGAMHIFFFWEERKLAQFPIPSWSKKEKTICPLGQAESLSQKLQSAIVRFRDHSLQTMVWCKPPASCLAVEKQGDGGFPRRLPSALSVILRHGYIQHRLARPFHYILTREQTMEEKEMHQLAARFSLMKYRIPKWRLKLLFLRTSSHESNQTNFSY